MSLEKRRLPFFLPCFAALRYDYLVDVLQRVGEHPANRVHDLSPPALEKTLRDKSTPLRFALLAGVVKSGQ